MLIRIMLMLTVTLCYFWWWCWLCWHYCCWCWWYGCWLCWLCWHYCCWCWWYRCWCWCCFHQVSKKIKKNLGSITRLARFSITLLDTSFIFLLMIERTIIISGRAPSRETQGEWVRVEDELLAGLLAANRSSHYSYFFWYTECISFFIVNVFHLELLEASRSS